MLSMKIDVYRFLVVLLLLAACVEISQQAVPCGPCDGDRYHKMSLRNTLV